MPVALRTDEILRIKGECGYNVTSVGGEAYALGGYVALFDKVIQPYLVDLGTTSTTVVVASSLGAFATLTLASNPAATGNVTQPLAFTVGSNVVVDVGTAAENSTITVLSGLTAMCLLFNAHGTNGVYPVVLKGAEQFIRDYLTRIDIINAQLNLAPLQGGVKKVDEVELFGSSGRTKTKDRFESLVAQRLQARRDLCLALGIPYLPDARRGGNLSFEAY